MNWISKSLLFPTDDVIGGNVEEPVIIDRVEHLRIMTIGINRPKKRNCVNEVNTSRVFHKTGIIFDPHRQAFSTKAYTSL